MSFCIFQIRRLKTPLEMLQEINRNTLGPLLPVDVISYIEALSYSSLNTMQYSVPDNEALRNTTINVSRSSLKDVLLSLQVVYESLKYTFIYRFWLALWTIFCKKIKSPSGKSFLLITKDRAWLSCCILQNKQRFSCLKTSKRRHSWMLMQVT